MKNYVVIHKLNGEIILRTDFGSDLISALNFIGTVYLNSYQNGKHLVYVYEEFTNEKIGDYIIEYTI